MNFIFMITSVCFLLNRIIAVQVMRRNRDAMKYIAGNQKKSHEQ